MDLVAEYIAFLLMSNEAGEYAHHHARYRVYCQLTDEQKREVNDRLDDCWRPLMASLREVRLTDEERRRYYPSGR